jgi:5-methylcytosine-specific restriction endonuclease McrA
MTDATRPTYINCARCGEQKPVGERGPIPTYCSANCRAALKYERSRQDGRYEQELAAARQKTRKRQRALARPCPYCKTPMANPSRLQCGAAACRRQFNADRMRIWQRDFAAAAGRPYNQNFAEQQRESRRRSVARLGTWRQRNPDQAATYDARRRMRIEQARTAETFLPRDVHARDEWTCQLCSLPIDATVAWPDLMSPSIDHRIPLSKGGAHSMANVQSAHLGCNLSKGDKL